MNDAKRQIFRLSILGAFAKHIQTSKDGRQICDVDGLRVDLEALIARVDLEARRENAFSYYCRVLSKSLDDRGFERLLSDIGEYVDELYERGEE